MADENGEDQIFTEKDLQPQTIEELDMDPKAILAKRIQKAADEMAAAAATGDFLEDMVSEGEDEARTAIEAVAVINTAKELLNSRFARRRYFRGGQVQDVGSISREREPDSWRDWPLEIIYTSEPENARNVKDSAENTDGEEQPLPILNPLVLNGVDVTRTAYGDREATKITDYFFTDPAQGGEVLRRTTLVLDYGMKDPTSKDPVIADGSISTIRKAKSDEVLAIPEKMRAVDRAERERQEAWENPAQPPDPASE